MTTYLVRCLRRGRTVATLTIEAFLRDEAEEIAAASLDRRGIAWDRITAVAVARALDTGHLQA
jgi:hypothetical protein